MPPLIPKTIYSLGCFTKTCFMKTVWSTCSASIWGLHWRNPKGFLNLACFRGFKSNFGFDLFYNVDIHSALTSQVSVWQIYNEDEVKREMICALPKNCQNQKSNGLAMADNSCLRRRRICTKVGAEKPLSTWALDRVDSAWYGTPKTIW